MTTTTPVRLTTADAPLPPRPGRMTTTLTRPAPGIVVVTVEHDPRQSYSRAVQPAAMRAARGHARALVSMADADDAPIGVVYHRTRTAYTFTV